MTREETKKILMILNDTFPNFKIPENRVSDMVDIWNGFFISRTYQEVLTAIHIFARTANSAFPPSVSQILDLCNPVEFVEATEIEAWNAVRAAIADSSYHAEERFEELPENIQKAIGSPSQLRSWAMMDTTAVDSVVASNFQRSYRTIMKRQRDRASLPEAYLAKLEEKLLEKKEATAIEDKQNQNATPAPMSEKEKRKPKDFLQICREMLYGNN